MEQQQGHDTTLSDIQDPPMQHVDPGQEAESDSALPEQDVVGMQFASYISASMNPPSPEDQNDVVQV